MQNHAEITGEPEASNDDGSARNTADTNHSKRFRSGSDNSENASDLHKHGDAPEGTIQSPMHNRQGRRRAEIVHTHTNHNLLKIPLVKSWVGTKDCDNVSISLNRLGQNLTAHEMSQADMPYQALDFLLEGKPFQL